FTALLLSLSLSDLLNMLSVVLGIIFVLLKVIQFYQERKKLIKALEAFPGPPKHWLYGHNHLVRRELGSVGIVSWGEEYAYAFPRWFGPVLPSLIIHHPEYAKSILGRMGNSLSPLSLVLMSSVTSTTTISVLPSKYSNKGELAWQ
uniref:Cytochrome P450 family 4 subfamily B member 1 n=1 Tax=Athene cunicularia TaxID=194338 RepID=A0A663M7U8_ATHCN